MTPLLIVALPDQQPPFVWWASDAYVIAASSRFDDERELTFDKAWRRYARMHDQAYCFETHDAAREWAETYTGPNWLEVRAEIACASKVPPRDIAPSE